MIFIDWWLVSWRCIWLLTVVVATFSFWLVRKKRWPVRLPVRFLSALLALSAAAMGFIMWGFPDPHTYSVPVYSPNKKMAVRIDETNLSGFGGADDRIFLFRAHGFISDVVFSGDWRSVEAAKLAWKSDSELEISYEGPVRFCASAPQVRVRCIGR
jgi:hypothetical protein